jgi:hypothetical protein
VADRYCRNCGHELGDEDRFCPDCGRPVHETAQVPTPEADVPVPPPPSPPQAQAPGKGRSRASRLLVGCLGVVLVLILLVVGLAAIGGGGGESAGGGSGPSGEGSGETFTRENYDVLVANPDEHVGATVDVTGQLLDNPEKQGDVVAFQMWADPVKIDWSTIVRTDKEALGLRTDSYVHVRGTVLGSIEGENAFGGTVSAVEVEADEVERVEAVDAIDPTIKTVEVGQTRSSEGFSMTLQKIEFGPRHTRAYVTARNDTDKHVGLDLYRSKITQGSERAGQTDPFDYNLPKPKPGLQPGEQTQGVVIFGKADPSQPLQVSFAWERGGFMADKPDPLVFEVTP